ncbi:hypothetical protein HLH33_17295 [Gluconacetobacter diazotrophicus]|uniref:Uncharacterized protein n=1 Tax=Gluconacetobacter diazotrophicus TaxID=33996 RepID=A0A7W4I836_GLUDI|nr:hypothetical protein [Gluconacetobacter diazotrophicus]MBB2158028.1 hypothetical protein [Gluconacetobacter diazotrophicus]
MEQTCDLVDGAAGLWTATGAQSEPISPKLICLVCANEWTPDSSTIARITEALCSACVDRQPAAPAASNNPPASARVSPAMARVLVNLYRGRTPWDHLRGRSMHGAAGQTERALRARGLVAGSSADLTLTDAGRECVASLST